MATALMVAAPNVLAQVADSTPATTGQAPTPKQQVTLLNATSTVKDNNVVEAGLLTSASATQLFGGWMAERGNPSLRERVTYSSDGSSMRRA